MAKMWEKMKNRKINNDFFFSYYDQLVAIEKKIPVSEVQIPFKWKDAFDKESIFGGRISLTVPSFAYERVCVLFNMGALSSLIGKKNAYNFFLKSRFFKN